MASRDRKLVPDHRERMGILSIPRSTWNALSPEQARDLVYGVMKPEMLLEEAAKVGVRTFALTDIHGTAGIPDFVRDAENRFGVRPVAGIEFRQGSRMLYIGIAKSNEGFQLLNELLSPHLLDGEALPQRAPELSGAFFIYPITNAPEDLRPNERSGIKPSDLTRLRFRH